MRRYNLDWLRVGVFALLILYHVGMFFVPWDWHIKNNNIFPKVMWPMLFINQWRLPILFVISGMGTYYALSKRTGPQFIRERTYRLIFPLLFGMVFIVPPQVYIERLDNGQFMGSYLQFWPTEAFKGAYPTGNLSWHHLWFLPYLYLFSVLLVSFFLYLRRNPQSGFIKLVRELTLKPFRLYWMILPLYFWESLLEPFFPSTHALVGDWFNLINYITLFVIGFLLVSTGDFFWNVVSINRRKYLFTAMVAFFIQVMIWLFVEDSIAVHFVEAFIKVVNLWSWVLVLFGYSAVWLNKPGSVLTYANEAVYPFYILHQTITLIIGFYLMNLDWGFWPKFLLMVTGSFGFSWLIYEFLIRRWKWIRPLFGMKNRKMNI